MRNEKENNNKILEREYKLRKKLIKFFRGTHQRFLKGTNFKENSEQFIDAFFEALQFDEDEQVITLVQKSYTEIKHILTPFRGDNYEIYKFLKILDCLYNVEYVKIIERFYR